MSRAELARFTGLTPQAIANIVDDLIGGGLVREAGRRKSPRGQPPIAIEIANDGGYAVSSYREVNPAVGMMDELAELATHLRHHGISLCLDFIFNHTSDEHEWALAALRGDQEYQRYYRMYTDRKITLELSDAAYVDGAGDFLILWRIILPLVKPALLVVAIFNFIYAWNDFLGPLLYLDDASKYPFSIGLYAFRTRFALQWNLLTAAALAITIPLIAAFFVLQKSI